VFSFWVEPDFFNTFNAEEPGETPIVGNAPAPTDVWVQISHLPMVGNVRVGSVKPPLSFEHMTSSRFLDFMERSLQFDAFIGGLDNGFQPGLVAFNWALEERLTWAVGLTKNNANIFGFNVGDGEYNLSARATGLPVYACEGRRLLHLGLGVSHRAPDDERARFRARTLVRNGPAALGTPLVDLRLGGEAQSLLVPELALVLGPFSLSTEYLCTWIQNVTFPLTPAQPPIRRGTAFFQGFHVDALFFLTGEHRPYNTREGVFTRVRPHENFFCVPGTDGPLAGRGAWQVGLRYSYLDLNDSGINGGIVHDLTLGLNWFLNPNMKWQFNYSLARRDVPGAVGNGIVQGLGVRFAFDF
jgi:phosphate-selective porin OprO/OprP